MTTDKDFDEQTGDEVATAAPPKPSTAPASNPTGALDPSELAVPPQQGPTYLDTRAQGMVEQERGTGSPNELVSQPPRYKLTEQQAAEAKQSAEDKKTEEEEGTEG